MVLQVRYLVGVANITWLYIQEFILSWGNTWLRNWKPWEKMRLLEKNKLCSRIQYLFTPEFLVKIPTFQSLYLCLYLPPFLSHLSVCLTASSIIQLCIFCHLLPVCLAIYLSVCLYSHPSASISSIFMYSINKGIF